MEISERKLSETASGAVVMCLPRWWCKSRNLGKGSYVVVTLDGEDLRITPKGKDGGKEEKRSV